MDIKERIIDLYFNKNYKSIEIARELNVCKSYVSKILKQDERYLKVKNLRKVDNVEKHIKETKKHIKQKREIESILNAQIKQQHIQATMELSGGHSISDHAFKKWNSSAYSYNDKKRCFVFNKKIGWSYAVPKYVK